MKRTLTTLATLSITLSLVACVDDFDHPDDFDEEEDLGAEMDLSPELEGTGAEDIFSCDLSVRQGWSASIAADYSLRRSSVTFGAISWDFATRQPIGQGNNQKVYFDIQLKRNGKWKRLKKNWIFSKNKISKRGTGTARKTRRTTYFVGSQYPVRLRIRTSWDEKLSGDPSKSCYRTLRL